MDELPAVWRRATGCEVCWLDRSGNPSALATVPLVDGEVPCVALPYCLASTAAGLRAAGQVAFAVTDSRSLPHGADGTAVIGTVTVGEDISGDHFVTDLLDQELLKYPPSRALADSLLLRRENWWWLPRVLVRLDRVDAAVPLPPRRDASRDALLVRDDGRGLRLDVASAPDWDAATVALRTPSGGSLRGDGAPTVALGHDHTPDRERWESWSRRGELRGDVLAVTEREGRPGLDAAPLRLLERLRRQRALERGCRAGIAAAERRS